MKQRFNWQKKGLFFSSAEKCDWMWTHGMLPTAELLGKEIARVYFASRNQNNQSYIGYCDVNLTHLKIINISEHPLLIPGKLGTFDDNGVLPSCVMTIDGKKYMYYIGFKPGGTTRMDLFGGLARFDASNHLERVSEAPILERCSVNPYINTAPFVIEAPSISPYRYLMYYVAGCGWIHKDLPRYNIQLAFSNDGLQWKREGHICIDFKDDHEVALARPYVLLIDGKYHMWFSYKGEAYKIGYAVSENGIDWRRHDAIGGLLPSEDPKAFDSEMVAYACVVPYKNQYFMFYNGNNYGRQGIGLAIADA